MDTTIINCFEIHYLFGEDDKTHSMDAFTRNKCEQEFLQIVSELSKELNTKVKIETEAHKEGGLKEVWSFICENLDQIAFYVAILGIIISRIPLRKTKLEKEDLQLSIEERKLHIELLRIELQQKGIQLAEKNLDAIENIFSNIKIIKHKSNFYKQLNRYPKVKRLSISKLNVKKEYVEEPVFIERADFNKFILESDSLFSFTDENATIEIVSPVLKIGKYKWRGSYTSIGTVIEFSMKDKEFKKNIIKNGVSFKSGTFIDCILEIERKVDDFGNIFNSNYSVLLVLRQHDEDSSIETFQGKLSRIRSEDIKNQLSLLFD